MAIPIEFCSVILRKDLLSSDFPGGVDAFFDISASGSYLEDEYLVRVSFMTTKDAWTLVDQVAARTGAPTPTEELAAVVDGSTGSADMPSWLESGTLSGQKCVWLATTAPGSIAAPLYCFSARHFRIELGAFREMLSRYGIALESPVLRDEWVLVRGATEVEAIVGIDDDALVGIMTLPPRTRSPDRLAHNKLLADLELVLRTLGWDTRT